jgi:hypothetical protein
MNECYASGDHSNIKLIISYSQQYEYGDLEYTLFKLSNDTNNKKNRNIFRKRIKKGIYLIPPLHLPQNSCEHLTLIYFVYHPLK